MTLRRTHYAMQAFATPNQRLKLTMLFVNVCMLCNASLLNNNSPLPAYNTRNTFFKYPIARHEYTRKTCLYQVINYVNYPPSNPLMKLRTDMSDTHSITGFALYHKNRTLESYSLHCRIIDCYVCRVCQ